MQDASSNWSLGKDIYITSFDSGYFSWYIHFHNLKSCCVNRVESGLQIPLLHRITVPGGKSLEQRQATRIQQLEEELEIWEDKLHQFRMDLAQAEGSNERFSIKQRIKNEILPEIKRINRQYNQVLAGIEVTDDKEVEGLITEMENLPKSPLDSSIPQEIQRQLEVLHKEIQDQDKSAAAKLKVVLPIIPLLANYELELDTESFLGQLWEKSRSLLRNKAASAKP